MAATPKPIRKGIKKASETMRSFTKKGLGDKQERKSMEKPSNVAQKLHAKEVKASHHKMKGETVKYEKAKKQSDKAHKKAFGK